MKTLCTLTILLLCCTSYGQYDNLLINAGHADSTNGWNVTKNGGDGVYYNKNEGYLRTSYNWFTESQTIDLVKDKKLSESYLDSEPIVLYSDFYKGYGGGSHAKDEYKLSIYLYDKDMKVIDSLETGTLHCDTAEWQQIKGHFSNYGKGLRFIKFEHSGRDAEFWAGNYGTELNNSYISVGNLLMYTSGLIGSNAGWEITKEGGNGWYEGKKSSNLRYFQTSYNQCEKNQLIDLIELGYSTEQLDSQPRITGGEFYSGYRNGSDTADEYYQKIELLDKDTNVIFSMDSTFICVAVWKEATFDFMQYGKGLRFIRYTHGGAGVNFWAGHYGSQMDRSLIQLGEPTMGLSVKDFKQFDALNIYPNPVKDNLNISISHTGSVSGTLCTVTDIQGRIIQEFNIFENETKLSVSNLDAGMYLITLTNASNNIKQTSKFIKQ